MLMRNQVDAKYISDCASADTQCYRLLVVYRSIASKLLSSGTILQIIILVTVISSVRLNERPEDEHVT